MPIRLQRTKGAVRPGRWHQTEDLPEPLADLFGSDGADAV
jgi:hypothetical protein